MSSLALLIILAFANIIGASADSNHNTQHTFTLTNKKIAPDGFRRTAVVVNGGFPGPVLTANKGESVKVKVVNNLDDPSISESTSIHWHGIFQTGNVQNDGFSFVSQCPISPGHEYTYNLELGNQTGTYWYHSHLGVQYVDGLRGAFIIYDPEDPYRNMYDIDDASTIIALSDWYHGTANAMLASFRNNGSEPAPDSGLVNGIGIYQGGPSVKLARINVVYGKRYRFRLVSMSANGFFDVSFSSHSMKVIEADGILHKPYCVDSINMAPGQRYSVVVTADQKIENYWIRVTQSVVGGHTSIPSNPTFNGNNTHAVLHYHGAPDAEPKDAKPTVLPAGGIIFEEHKLTPLADPGLPGGEFPPDLVVYNFTYNIGSNNGDVWTVNNVAYKPPHVPTLLNILANGFSNASQFGPDENTIILPSNATVEVVFSAPSPVGPGHAFHLSGHAFDVVQSATGPPNFINPPRRDVVISGEQTRIRFRTDNSGPWALYCHIIWHLNSGLAAVLVEDPQAIKKNIKPNAEWEKLCSIYDKLQPSQQG